MSWSNTVNQIALILHGNSIDNTISSTKFEQYVVNNINSRLELPFNISEAEIDVCHPLP